MMHLECPTWVPDVDIVVCDRMKRESERERDSYLLITCLTFLLLLGRFCDCFVVDPFPHRPRRSSHTLIVLSSLSSPGLVTGTLLSLCHTLLC